MLADWFYSYTSQFFIQNKFGDEELKDALKTEIDLKHNYETCRQQLIKYKETFCSIDLFTVLKPGLTSKNACKIYPRDYPIFSTIKSDPIFMGLPIGNKTFLKYIFNYHRL